MDTIKDEVERCHMTTPSPDHLSTSSERLNLTSEHPGTMQTQCYEPSFDEVSTRIVGDPFDTDSFGPTVYERGLNISSCVGRQITSDDKYNLFATV